MHTLDGTFLWMNWVLKTQQKTEINTIRFTSHKVPNPNSGTEIKIDD